MAKGRRVRPFHHNLGTEMHCCRLQPFATPTCCERNEDARLPVCVRHSLAPAVLSEGAPGGSLATQHLPSPLPRMCMRRPSNGVTCLHESCKAATSGPSPHDSLHTRALSPLVKSSQHCTPRARAEEEAHTARRAARPREEGRAQKLRVGGGQQALARARALRRPPLPHAAAHGSQAQGQPP